MGSFTQKRSRYRYRVLMNILIVWDFLNTVLYINYIVNFL